MAILFYSLVAWLWIGLITMAILDSSLGKRIDLSNKHVMRVVMVLVLAFAIYSAVLEVLRELVEEW